MLKIQSPTLLLDEEKCRKNIRQMAAKARQHGLHLEPHFKTHQSAAVGEWFREQGAEAITVTSVKMADYFAAHGWKKITIAMPANILEVEAIQSLARKVDLNIYINHPATAAFLARRLREPVGFFIEIDAGYHRTGVDFRDHSALASILSAAGENPNLRFRGCYAHAGNTYDGPSREDILRVHRQTCQALRSVKDHFAGRYPDLQLALGDTPACSIADDFTGIDIIRPGNYVYYDLVQATLGACTYDQIAICLAVPVVDIYPARSEVIAHGGWVHHGKDALPDAEGRPYYGKVVTLSDNGWSEPVSGGRVTKLSQEHTTLELPATFLEKLRIGDLLGVLPIHSCATAQMMGAVTTLSGESIAMMR